MLEVGKIEKSHSTWCSPKAPVVKKDGCIRFCVDYRKVNEVSQFDAYPMPQVNELLDQLCTARFFMVLDLTKGYWQIPLSGAPATFQRLMDRVLQLQLLPPFWMTSSQAHEILGTDSLPDIDEPTLIGGDIAIKPGADRNADPCTSRGCMWGKWTDGKVYVPYYIANHYSSREIAIITRGLESFSSISCIRFRPYQDGDHEWLSIESRNGCYSYVGRQGGGQTVSLSRQGCLYHSTVQHELLHALGFNHEQTRSDRDNHIRVYWENILDDMIYNFYKIDTLNQGKLHPGQMTCHLDDIKAYEGKELDSGYILG
ncbi:zinc metalloproteinase nas-8-like [Neolamprologus brichardi]|uniref:zinc metalloproteinase nas-8-like n=1 Tax=Neolamprologus brichardi TaxID=32507 RepID=UPI0016437B3D|nr:zinc metalloproteinase nas-8-like [Neolamprologus brichardi]